MSRVVVTGVPRSGARTLAQAVGEVDVLLSAVAMPPEAVATRAATVGLLVVEPSALGGDDDLSAMRALRSAVGHVAIVVTKVDAFWDWPTVARATRAVLDPTEDLPVFAVSAAAALAGAVDESGVDALVAWIRECLAEGSVAPRPAASPSRPVTDEIADLRRRRARVARGRDRGRTDRLAAVRSGLARVRASAVGDTAAGLREITAESDGVVARMGARHVADHRRWLADRVQHLQGAVLADVDDELDRLRAAVLLGIESFRPEPRAPASPIVLRDPPPPGAPTEEVVGALLGAASGFAVARFLVEPFVEVDVVRQISTPLALVVGLAIGLVITSVRRRSALRSRVRAATAASLAEARSVIEQDVAVRVADAETVVTGRVLRHAERRAGQAAREVADIDDRIRAVAGGTDRRVGASNSQERSGPRRERT
ncbi:MAG: hypothetical protein PGN29_15735 [Gordonia paraffinivorans]